MLLACTGLMLAGCAIQAPPLTEPAAVEAEIPMSTPTPTPEPDARIDEQPAAPDKARQSPIAILLSSDQPAYLDVAVELAGYFDDHKVYNLGSESLPPVSILRSINDTEVTALVAIGLRAAQSAVAMSHVPVVFSQVFNHRGEDLLKKNSRGIAAYAPLDAQLAAWKKADATVSRIGVIIGQGHEDLLAEAELAAARHNIELRVQIAHSDQETLYLFRRMIHDIDGFWLFPDNRILSARVLNQMLEDANRQQLAFVVPNESMLSMGATMSMSTVAADIAATIAEVVRGIQAGDIDKVPQITALSEVRVTINEKSPTRQTLADTQAAQ